MPLEERCCVSRVMLAFRSFATLSLKLYMHRNHRLGSTSDVHANVISSASNSQTKLNLITYGIPLLI
jgi:hypothetical protein